MNKDKFQIKDSGKREEYKSGMIRDTAGDKIDFSLIYDGPMMERWARHLTLGAKKYQKRNWMRANGLEELERFRESAARHFAQWMNGKTDECHEAGVYFNINAYEYLKEKLNTKETLLGGLLENKTIMSIGKSPHKNKK
ncbi:MAG: DUF5664 domain-containing protein [bacterium]|nr:DUF5664 domain-containing protein [bacterium]